MSRPTLLTVDLSNYVYRAAAMNSRLTSRRTFTGGLYGFLVTLAKVIRETHADRVVICEDRKPYLRSQDYPAYKQVRKAQKNEELAAMVKESSPLILEAMQIIGIPVWGLPGFEADDLAAHCVAQHRARFRQIYVATNDSDTWQLLVHPNVAIYKDGIHNLVTSASLMQQHGITPQQHMLATALMGTHNDVEGIPGVGDVRSKEAVKNPAKLKPLQEKHGALIKRNLDLIRLPHPKFPWHAQIPGRTDRFSAQRLYRFCGRYDIDVTQPMLNSFDRDW